MTSEMLRPYLNENQFADVNLLVLLLVFDINLFFHSALSSSCRDCWMTEELQWS